MAYDRLAEHEKLCNYIHDLYIKKNNDYGGSVTETYKKYGMTSDEFATELLKEQKVAVVPGTAFGDCGEGFVRCSYATSVEKISEAIARIEHFVQHCC